MMCPLCGILKYGIVREEVIYLKKSKKKRHGPDLEKYIRVERRYTTYREASRFYSIQYYRLVRLAKEADACWKIRKTVLVDLDKLDAYIENFKDGGNESWDI